MLSLKRPQFNLNRGKIFAGSVILLIFFAFFWHLATYLPGASSTEVATVNTSAGLHSIYHNPINGPYLLINYLLQKAGLHTLTYFRLESIIFALIFVACFYKIARTWFGKFIATVTSLIFATTPLVVLAARNATPDIMFLLPLAIGVFYFYVSKSDEIEPKFVIGLMAISALSLYTPGMFWLIMLGVYAARKDLLEIAQSLSKKFLAACLLLFILIVLPLVASSTENTQIIKSLLLIPDHIFSVPTLKSSLWSVLSVFWHSGTHNLLQVGKLPLLNYTQLILAAFGVYALWSRARGKVYGLGGLILFGCLAFSFTGIYSISLITVIASLVLVAAGLRYLYMEWRGVFPRNPLPRSLASFLLILVAVINVGYGLRYALIAWPHTVDTRAAYVLKLQGTKGVKN